jgi:hypothetical protein
VTANAEGGSTSAPPTGSVTPTAGPGPGPGPGPVQPVPTLSQWGVMLLAAMMLFAGVRRQANRS